MATIEIDWADGPRLTWVMSDAQAQDICSLIEGVVGSADSVRL